MSFQLSTTLRNAAISVTDNTVGASPILKIWSGAVPANCAAADSGTDLVSMTLPSTWLGAASGGAVALAGSWTGSGIGTGTAGYFRIYDPAGTTCHIQGSVTITGGGGDMTLDNPSIATGQTVTITGFTLTAGGT